MEFGESVKTCFNKYATFHGRASRSEFWWWVLFNLIASACLGILSNKLYWVFTLATLLPYLAVTSRRLHDTNRSGWTQLVGLIPIVGWLIVLYWLCQDTKPYASFD